MALPKNCQYESFYFALFFVDLRTNQPDVSGSSLLVYYVRTDSLLLLTKNRTRGCVMLSKYLHTYCIETCSKKGLVNTFSVDPSFAEMVRMEF